MDLISIVIGLAVGIVLGLVFHQLQKKKILSAQADASTAESDKLLKDGRERATTLVTEAEQKAAGIVETAEARTEKIKQRKIRENKEKFAQRRAEFETWKAEESVRLKDQEVEAKTLLAEMRTEKSDFGRQKKEIETGREALKGREEELQSQRDQLKQQLLVVEQKQDDLDTQHERFIRELEKIANMTEETAREQLMEATRARAENEAMALIRDRLAEARETAAQDAKKIVIKTIQRTCAEITIENTVSVFNLESDDLKGQIIGREGRNIRALEAATGAEFVVDDTPEAIVISSFDPVRREVARLSLKRLVADGRIHPARIEEVVAKTQKELDEQIREIGKRTVIELDIHGLHRDLVRMVGRMRYRSSYGQNLLKHSIETAHLCAAMAAEMGLPSKVIKLAKRAGLLHDIGKVAEEPSELPHALLGMELAEKVKEHPAVLNAIGAHHDEIEMTGIVSPIVQACDAISGSRPGARREILESYLKRLGDLEKLAMSHDGVSTAFAMQAGRELRVIVESDKVTDEYADELSFKISEKIQNEMQYPGQIRVTVIREKRSVAYAR